ncbi:MAG: phosphorylase family protein [bacterium]
MVFEGIIKSIFTKYISKFNDNERTSYSIFRTKTTDEIAILCVGREIESEIIRKSILSYKKGYTRRLFFGRRWVTLYRCGIGTIDCDFNVKALHNAGAKVIIRVDICGGLKAHVGDIVIASEAIALDSFTTGRIGSSNLRADSSLLNKSAEIANKKLHKNEYHIGKVVTVDEFFGQSESNLKRLLDFGIAVDMETSALYYLANQLDIEVISIMCVSDSPLFGEDLTRYPETFPLFRYKKGIKNMVRILKALVRKIK